MDNSFNNGKKYYPCPGQVLVPMPPADGGQTGFDFTSLKEPGRVEMAPHQESQLAGLAQDENPARRVEELPGIPTTALTRFDVQAAAIAEIRKYQSLAVDLTDKKTLNVAKKAKSVVRDLRLKIQRREKSLVADLNKKKKDLKGDAAAIISDIKPIENHLAAEIKKWEDEQAKIEKIRVDLLNKNFDTLVETCNKGLKPGLSSGAIKSALGVLETTAISREVFQEKYQEACNLLNHSIESTRQAHQAAVVYEEKQAEMKRVQLEADRVSQIGWFNENFGILADLATMESGLKNLEEMDPPAHLAELVASQTEQARLIVEKTKEQAAHAAALKSPPKTKEAAQAEEKEQAPEEARAPKKDRGAARGSRRIDSLNCEYLTNNLASIQKIVKAASPGSLELIISNGQDSTPAYLTPEGRDAVLVLIESEIKRAMGFKNEKA